MPVVWIPSLLQSFTDGEDRVEVSGATVREIIDNLESRFPGVKDRLVNGGEIRPHIAVAIDGDVSPEGLEQDVHDSSEIHFIPALSGGLEIHAACAKPRSHVIRLNEGPSRTIIQGDSPLARLLRNPSHRI